MWYAIISTDRDNSLENRKKCRPAHLARLQTLKDQGRLLVAGPHPAIDAEDPGEAGYSGSLVIAEFDDLEQARRWADEDPYIAGDVYAQVIVKPFKAVLP